MESTGSPRTCLDPQVVSRLAAIPLFARRPMLGSVSGRHPSPHRGASVEFAEYRKYVPGDDLRRLDWRAYGRSDRYFVKEFEADTNLRCCLVVDTSGSMGFGSCGTTKIEYAKKLAACLGYIAAQQGDAVGLAAVANRIAHSLPPKRNAAHLKQILDVLEGLRPSNETQLVGVLHELAETVRQRALVVVISDFFVEPELLASALQHLRFRRHDVALLHLLDPQEVNFTFQRPMRFLDMEGGPSIFAEPSDIADRYHKALQKYLSDVRRVVLESGIDYHVTTIDHSYETFLAKFLVSRTHGQGAR